MILLHIFNGILETNCKLCLVWLRMRLERKHFRKNGPLDWVELSLVTGIHRRIPNSRYYNPWDLEIG